MNRDKQTGFYISKESVDKLFPKKDIDILGYKSPIELFLGEIRTKQENGIFTAIQEYGVSVDKDELIKALQYDRDQYVKGYINGYNAKASEVAREIIKDLLTFAEDNEKQMLINGHSVWFINADDVKEFIAELKEKYESEGEG